MLSFLPSGFLGCLSLVLVTLNTLLWCVPFYVFGAIYRLGRSHEWRRRWSPPLLWLGEGWVWCNAILLDLVHDIDFEVHGTEGLRHDSWYLVTSNHQSWVDIPVLQTAFNKKIPFLKFFVKQQLIWVPILGLAWWFLGLPFMKRYSRAELEKNPALKGKDMDEVRRACDHFRDAPVGVLNFVEGTRFTNEKHDAQGSPYRHLLRPKAGGVSSVVSLMGDSIRSLLDVTIVYPGGIPTFWEFASGRTRRIIVDVVERRVPSEFFGIDYDNDSDARARFQEWISGIWAEKDEKIERLMSQHAHAA